MSPASPLDRLPDHEPVQTSQRRQRRRLRGEDSTPRVGSGLLHLSGRQRRWTVATASPWTARATPTSPAHQSNQLPHHESLQPANGGQRRRLRGQAQRRGLGPGLLHLSGRQQTTTWATASPWTARATLTSPAHRFNQLSHHESCAGGHAGGFDDAFVAKINAAGSALVYSTYLGGSGVIVARHRRGQRGQRLRYRQHSFFN